VETAKNISSFIPAAAAAARDAARAERPFAAVFSGFAFLIADYVCSLEARAIIINVAEPVLLF
jgi:hypothetical protein